MKIQATDFIKIPNIISLFRISLLIPLVLLLADLETNRSMVVVIIFIALISDLLDGFIARKTNQISELGKILDPLGDKLFVIVLVTSLYIYNEIDDLYFYTIILRDVVILIGGIVLSKLVNKVLPSNFLGKVCALSIAAYIFLTLVGYNNSSYGVIIYYLGLFLSVISLLGYAYRGVESVNWYRKNEISQKS
jgi:CDP-diacylglycerol--glycerol-3-phosphate 3-phosphatidyltransferase